MKIIGFFHISVLNHYLEVINNQLNLLLESGLYEKADNIFVGCTGESIEKVEELFRPHKKIKILSHSKEHTVFEFLTLRILHDKAKSEKPFYGFYLHTKGVSYPNQPHREGGDYWRDYMNHFLITRWEDNVKKLDEGYETSGVKFIKDGFPPHYSGNFFWFKSDYAKKLAPITRLNTKDRYSAEMWLCSNNPKVANLCDLFVDYKTRGKFDPNNIPKTQPRIEKKEPVKEPEPKKVEPVEEGFKISDILKGYDLSTRESKELIKRMNRFDAVAKEVIADYYRFRNCSVDYLWENLARLFKDSSGYKLRE